MIRRLYLDTNSLEGHWPFTVSGQAAIVAQMARRLGIEVCIPNSVVIEHVNSSIRHAVEQLEEANKHIAKAEWFLNHFINLPRCASPLEIEYRTAHAAAIT